MSSTKEYRDKNRDQINEYRRNWYRNHPQEKHRLLECERRRRDKFKLWWDSYKASLKCEICGEDHPATFDFHHKDPAQKEICISRLIKKCNKERVLRELSKCQVLCSNCHRIVHYEAMREGNPLEKSAQSEPSETKRPPKSELEKLIWEIPSTEIAKRYGVSDKSVQKWAVIYGLEKPGRGYWTRKKYGKI